jgi:hypothetical protein
LIHIEPSYNWMVLLESKNFLDNFGDKVAV